MSVLLINLQIQYFSWISPETWGMSSKILLKNLILGGHFHENDKSMAKNAEEGRIALIDATV